MTAAPPLSDRGLRRIGAVAVIGPILALVDAGIVNVGIETLTDRLDAPLATIQWSTTAYLLAVAVSIPVTAWTGDRLGARSVWLGAMALFVAASALCALAWSAEALIAFRALQGFGGGALEPAMLTLVTRSAGAERAGRAVAWVGAPLMLGPALGPVVGGAILEHLSWHWMFLVNVPIGLVALAVAARVLPRAAGTGRPAAFDARGVALLAAGGTGLVLGLAQLAERGVSGTAVVATGVGAIALLAYPAHAGRLGDSAVIALRLVRAPAIRPALIGMCLTSAGLFAYLFVVALDLQIRHGEAPLAVGGQLAVEAAGAACGFALVARSRRRLALPGGVAFTCSAAMFAFGGDASTAVVVPSLALGGLGLGVLFATAMGTMYAAAGPADASRLGGVIFMSQQICAAVGVAAATLVVGLGGGGRFPGAYAMIAAAGALAAVVMAASRTPRESRAGRA